MVAFASVPDGTAADAARALRGLHAVVLREEDRPELLRAAVPELGALFVERDGGVQVPYEVAFMLFGGLLEVPAAPTGAGGTAPKWESALLAPHRMQAAWAAACPLHFGEAPLVEAVESVPPFWWWRMMQAVRARLPTSVRVLDLDADLYAVEPDAAPPDAWGGRTRRRIAAGVG